MLNRCGESGYSCIIPDLREKAVGFSPLSKILTVDILYQSEEVPYIPSLLRAFNSNGC